MVVFIVLTALFAMTCPSPIIEDNSLSCKPAPATTLCTCTFLSSADIGMVITHAHIAWAGSRQGVAHVQHCASIGR